MALGEGPHWDAKSQSLYVVDINGPNIYRYSPSTNKTIKISFGSDPIGFIVPVNNQKDHFLVGEKLNLTMVHWDTETNKLVSKEILAALPEPGTNRINDGKADASGRIWFGTMTDGTEIVPGAGSFYSYSKKEGLRKHQENITISNGIAITADNQTFYYIDSMKHRVEAYDFDMKDGKMNNLRVVFDFKKKNVSGSPDGMTIDADGNLWVACFDGRQVIQINPANGEVLQSVKFPRVCQTTSVVFGGPNLDELYVTTAEIKITAEEKEMFPESGSVYRVTGLNTKGLHAANFDLLV
ncbi:anterior fat body protein [Nesidiocoris tenuis]|nr:anterior fat body protein [Nesidiocoris tenuis]